MMNDSLSRKYLLLEAEHTEMYDERDKETMLEMIRSCPSPKERHYHFVFEDESCFDTRHALSLKEAVLEASEYTGYNSELFRKALKGFDESDVRGIVDIYNHFTKDRDYNIKTVMLVSSVLYEELE